jgi:hypothetical protein
VVGMKVHLMYRDRDVDPEAPLPAHESDLTQDLGLDPLLDAMAGGDRYLREIAQRTLLSPLTDPEQILYRQQVLADTLAHPDTVAEIYTLTVQSMEQVRRESVFFFRDSPTTLLHHSVNVLGTFLGALTRLRAVADEHAAHFRSPGFTALFDMIVKELDDEYLRTVREHLSRLQFRRGVLVGARLTVGNKGAEYTVRKPLTRRRGWREHILPGGGDEYTIAIPDRDEAGSQALEELRKRGVNQVAAALGRSTDHIGSFFTLLRAELAFYLGAANLHRILVENGEPVCFPQPAPPTRPVFAARDLYDVALNLRTAQRVVGNDVNADGKALIVITGANQGGKSTLLRAAGLARLMAGAGMFAPAQELRCDAAPALFTHYKREEDDTMQSGKFDEELIRLRRIAEHLGPGGVVLLNESLAATNEREGAEIALPIVRAMLEAGIKAVIVTHSYELAEGLRRAHGDDALFLRAERRDDGQRTFRLTEGAPLRTSYGQDLYRRVFEHEQSTDTPASPAVPSEPASRP